MANWNTLRQAIASVIKTNDNQEITGQALQSVLLSMVNALGAGGTFAGIARPDTVPGTPDGPTFYIASAEGTYINFSGIIVQRSEGVVLLQWNDSAWTKVIPNICSKAFADTRVAGVSIGYYECDTAGSSNVKVITDLALNELWPGASIKIKMANACEHSGPAILLMAGFQRPLLYNGKLANSSNTWKAGAIIEVFVTTGVAQVYATDWQTPTPQHQWNDYVEGNYAYCENFVRDGANHKVIPNINSKLEQNDGKLKIRWRFWGNGPMDGGNILGVAVPVATTDADGAMSKEDKIKLEGLDTKIGFVDTTLAQILGDE